jgi:SAM-dependent methyltransferase
MKIDKMTYNKMFYDSVEQRASKAASEIACIFRNYFEVNNIKDVGCGSGIWIREFEKIFRFEKLTGYDLESGVIIANSKNREDKIEFLPIDFEKDKLKLKNTDLTLFLEVAEHLTPTTALKVIEEICRTSKYVIFSGAIKGQGGTNHINEQSAYYWIKKFEDNDFVAIDLFRETIKDMEKIPFYYRNNIFLFINNDEFKKIIISNSIKELELFNLKINSELPIKDYRNIVQKILYKILSKVNYKIVNKIIILKDFFLVNLK